MEKYSTVDLPHRGMARIERALVSVTETARTCRERARSVEKRGADGDTSMLLGNNGECPHDSSFNVSRFLQARLGVGALGEQPCRNAGVATLLTTRGDA